MKLLSIALALTLALSGPASFAIDLKTCKTQKAEIKALCEAQAEQYETTVAEQRLVIQAQDKVIGNLREQRDLALEGSGGGIFTDFLVPVLVGAALTTVIIGIRR